MKLTELIDYLKNGTCHGRDGMRNSDARKAEGIKFVVVDMTSGDIESQTWTKNVFYCTFTIALYDEFSRQSHSGYVITYYSQCSTRCGS